MEKNFSVFKKEEGDKQVLENPDYIRTVLQKMKESADEFDLDALDLLMEELNKYLYEGETAELMGLLEDQIRNISLTDAVETIEKLLKI